jgi:hypothetical protein
MTVKDLPGMVLDVLKYEYGPSSEGGEELDYEVV